MIIPALNEAESISAVVAAVLRAKPHEVIVVDGGSTDATAELAAQAGAVVLAAPPGRGLQQRLGAERAQGQALLFVLRIVGFRGPRHCHLALGRKPESLARPYQPQRRITADSAEEDDNTFLDLASLVRRAQIEQRRTSDDSL